MAAAESIRQRDGGSEIATVTSEPEGYYSRPGLAYYLAREVPETSLFPFTPKDFSALNVRQVLGVAAGLDPAAHAVTLADGQTLSYDRLLIATGSIATPVDAPGAELDGVIKLDDLADARGLIQRSRSARSAVVVGGGITALEIVEGLMTRGVKVHYLMRKDRYWGNVLSESESRLVEESLAAMGVEIHRFTEVARIVGRDGRVAAVETKDGTQIGCEMVAVAIGVRPRKELAEAAGLRCGRGVLVDEFMRSSDGDIYAAGDVAESLDPRTQRPTLEILWNSAVAKGRIAGLNMAGEPTHAFTGGEPLNITRLAGFKVTIIGSVGSGTDSDVKDLVRGDSEAWRHSGDAVMVETQLEDAHVRLAVTGGVITGAIVVGDQGLSYALQQLISAKADIGPMVPELMEPGARVDALVDGYWRDWRMRGA
jgi:NAD(P)H-nitrite reductase large subunit